MRVQLHHPRVIQSGKAGVDGRALGKGVHDISQEEADHWFTQAEMKAGHITMLVEPKAEKPKDEKKKS